MGLYSSFAYGEMVLAFIDVFATHHQHPNQREKLWLKPRPDEVGPSPPAPTGNTILPPNPPASIRACTSRAAASGNRSTTTGWIAPSRNNPSNAGQALTLNSSRHADPSACPKTVPDAPQTVVEQENPARPPKPKPRQAQTPRTTSPRLRPPWFAIPVAYQKTRRAPGERRCGRNVRRRSRRMRYRRRGRQPPPAGK